MLESKYCGRNQDSDLLVISHSLECGTDCDLGLAESNIAANQTVHGATALHIGLDVECCLELVRSILIHEAGLQLILHIGVGTVGKTLVLQAFGVQFDKVARNVLDLALGALLHALPGACTKFVNVRLLALLALVF